MQGQQLHLASLKPVGAWTQRICPAPVRHGCIWVRRCRELKRSLRFVLVKGILQKQALRSSMPGLTACAKP